MANADDVYEPHIIENSSSIFFSVSKIDIVSYKYCFYYEKTKKTSIAASQEKLKVGIQLNLFKLTFFNNPFHIFNKKIDEIMLDNGSLFLETQVCDLELFFRAYINNFNLYYSDYLAGKYRKHERNNSDKPNGERYSWLFDVFPIYRQFLLKNHKIETRNLIKSNIFHLFKYHVKNLKLIEIRQLRTFVKEYFVFIK